MSYQNQITQWFQLDGVAINADQHLHDGHDYFLQCRDSLIMYKITKLLDINESRLLPIVTRCGN